MKAWENLVVPRLTLLETKPSFDFIQYGNDIVSKYTDVDEKHEFYELCPSDDVTEVSRVFLASLMLVSGTLYQAYCS